MLRGLGISAGIFILFFAVGFGLLQWRTHEPDFLAQRGEVAGGEIMAVLHPVEGAEWAEHLAERHV